MSQPSLIIGTRSSKLAMWQAHWVGSLLLKNGIQCSIQTVESQGDKDQTTPLHQIGGNGLFTKTLDEAILNKEVDIAVHSLKDYPTQTHPDIKMGAYLERADYRDILIFNPNKPEVKSEKDVRLLATGSVRRTAQWLHRFPETEIVGLRGNVPTRLSKLENSDWDAIILAYAGILRLDIEIPNSIPLDWMVPAPAQGIVGVTARTGDSKALSILDKINHADAEHCAKAERTFMAGIESGCSVPIGALATLTGDEIKMKTCISKPKGDVAVQMHFKSNLMEYPIHLKNWINYIKTEVIRDHWWNE